jgi:hypothetical protein
MIAWNIFISKPFFFLDEEYCLALDNAGKQLNTETKRYKCGISLHGNTYILGV